MWFATPACCRLTYDSGCQMMSVLPTSERQRARDVVSSGRDGPRFSAVITNWNRKDDLRDLLNHIYVRVPKDVEVIIVDNGSTDGSVEMVQREFPSVRLLALRNSEHGACETYNMGIRMARGPLLALLDNDVVIEPEWFDQVYTEFARDATLAVVACRVENYYTQELDTWVYPEPPGSSGSCFFTSTFFGCAAGLKTDLVKLAGGFPEEYYIYHNEFALAAKLLNTGHRIRYCPKIRARHKSSSTQRIKSRLRYYGIRNWYWYTLSYYPTLPLLQNLAIHTVRQGLGALKDRETRIFLRAVRDTIKGSRRAFDDRQPISSPYFRAKIW